MLANLDTSHCFPRERWADFLDGNVDHRKCEQMALHLETCDSCLHKVESIEQTTNPLMQCLRSPANGGAMADTGCRQMLQAIQASLSTLEPVGQSSTVDYGGTQDFSARSAASKLQTGEHDALFKQLPVEFGRYRLLKRLGQGGMGSVYLAHDSELDRKVALKIPRFDGRQDATTRERFFREARAAATLEHPSICPIYDVGTIDGIPFLTMQCLPGETLASHIRRQSRLDRGDAARLVADLADGLAAAHTRGVIHRDVKPSNVMLLNGNPILMDFGLARRHGETSAEQTQSGAIVGSPAYMAPEQARGDQSAIGPATDIYGLGAVLFEMLTGRPPVQGSLLEILNQIADGPVPEVHRLRGDYPDELDGIVKTAMARQIKDRYASMSDFAMDLRRYVVVHSDRELQTLPSPSDRHRRARLLTRIGLAVTAMGCILAVVLVMNRPGTITIRHNESNAEMEVLRKETRVALLPASLQPHILRLPPGSYRFQMVGTSDKRPVPDRINLNRGQEITIALEDSPALEDLPKRAAQPTKSSGKENSEPALEVVTRPKPARAVFEVAAEGLVGGDRLTAVEPVKEWRDATAFANLNAAGSLIYPVLPTADYVMEVDFEIPAPGQFLHFELGDNATRVLILIDWDDAKKQYKVRLQRRHGRGSWFVNWKFYRMGERVKLRLLRYQGLAMLFDGNHQILGIDSGAVHPRLSVRFGGESPHKGKIYDCQFRLLTAEELEAAKTELAKARPPVIEDTPNSDQPTLIP